jgi:hypothetical protein
MYKILGVYVRIGNFILRSKFLYGKQLRRSQAPNNFIHVGVGNKCKKDRRADRYDSDKIKIRKDLAF